MREPAADDFRRHGGDGDREGEQQHRFIVGTVIVLMRGSSVMRMVVAVIVRVVVRMVVTVIMRDRVIGFRMQ